MTETTRTAGGISIHAVDVAHGVPAANLSVLLRRYDPDATEIASGHCEENGHFLHPHSR